MNPTMAQLIGGTPAHSRYLNMTFAQRVFLWGFMEKHPELTAGRQDVKSKMAAARMWLRLKRQLDARGPPYEVLVWKRVWLCMQKEAKKRQKLPKKSRQEQDCKLSANKDKKILEVDKHCEAMSDNCNARVGETAREDKARKANNLSASGSDMDSEDSIGIPSAATIDALSAAGGTTSVAEHAPPIAEGAPPVSEGAPPVAEDTPPDSGGTPFVSGAIASVAEANLSITEVVPFVTDDPSSDNNGASSVARISLSASDTSCTIDAALRSKQGASSAFIINNSNLSIELSPALQTVSVSRSPMGLPSISTTQDQTHNSNKLTQYLMRRRRRRLEQRFRANRVLRKVTDKLRTDLLQLRRDRMSDSKIIMKMLLEQHKEHYKITEVLLRMVMLMQSLQEQHRLEIVHLRKQRQRDQDFLFSVLSRLHLQQDQVQMLVEVLMQQTGVQVPML